MKMSWCMILEIHKNDHSVECTQLWHMFSFRLVVRFTFDAAKVRKKTEICKYSGINHSNLCHFSVIHYVNVRFCSSFECWQRHCCLRERFVPAAPINGSFIWNTNNPSLFALRRMLLSAAKMPRSAPYSARHT